MILLLALAGGLPVGMAQSRWRGRPYQPPELRWIWLAFLAFLPQFTVLYLPGGRTSDWFAATCLLSSLLCFLAFTWLNRRVVGMSILMIGLALNLAVIASNGGFMPISPQTAGRLVSENVQADLVPGSRFGPKDILTLPERTRLEFLADRFLPPEWIAYRVAFSLGDVFIALGAFSLLAFPGLNFKKDERSFK
jgi:hypothetical protein